MAKVYCTGPVQIYCGVGGSGATGTPLYLGTGETAPDIDIKAEWDAVMNDLGGNKLPQDRLYQGEEGMISVVLTRLNWDTLARMMARPDYTGTPGTNIPGDIGTLMGQEGMTYKTWCVFPYAAKTFQTDMPAGFRFLSTFLLSPDKIKGGTPAKKISCIIQAQRSFSVSGTGPNNVHTGTWRLYDDDMTGLPAFD